jgi:hypothetical protein
MKALVLGGPRQGEWVDAMGATWVDLMAGETYVIRRVTWAVAGVGDIAAELWKLPVAVHPSIVAAGPNEGPIAEQVLFGIIATTYMTDFMRANAEPQELAEPAVTVPPTPAELFDDSGNPIDGEPRRWEDR